LQSTLSYLSRSIQDTDGSLGSISAVTIITDLHGRTITSLEIVFWEYSERRYHHLIPVGYSKIKNIGQSSTEIVFVDLQPAGNLV
jgi:hypothetical protein